MRVEWGFRDQPSWMSTEYYNEGDMETECIQDTMDTVPHTDCTQTSSGADSSTLTPHTQSKLPPYSPCKIMRSSVSERRKLHRGRTREVISLIEEYCGNSKEVDPRVPFYQLLISSKLPSKNKESI